MQGVFRLVRRVLGRTLGPRRYYSELSIRQRIKKTGLDLLREKAVAELQYERERHVPFTEGEEFIRTIGFTLLESKDATEVRLKKPIGDKTVEIVYHAQVGEPDPSRNKILNAEDQKEEKVEDKKFSKDPLQIIILVKDKNGAGLLFDCASEEKGFNIKRIVYNPNVEAFLKKFTIEQSQPTFKSADFLNPTDELRAGFAEYLKSLGITDKLIAFLECSALDKEERLYMNWLEQLEQFSLNSKQP